MKKIKKLLVIVVAACTLFCMFGCSLKDYFEKIDNTLDSYINGTSSSEKENSSSERPSTSSSEKENSSSERPSTSSSEMENSSSERPSASSSETENSSSIDVEDEETETLVMPDNVLDLVCPDLSMEKPATLRFESCSEESADIRFKFSVSAGLKAEVENDENKRLVGFFIPLKFLDLVNINNYLYMDWITALRTHENAASMIPSFTDTLVINTLEDGSYEVGCYLYDVPLKWTNIEMVGMCVLITTDSDGNETYKYSTYASGNYRTNACSVGYLAAQVLNEYALGQGSYTAEQVELCKTYVNWSVALANGLTEPTDDDSTYTVIDYCPSISLSVGSTYTVNVKIAEDLRVPVAYKSLDESVATVSETGEIKAVSAGNTIIAVYVAGVPYSVSVTVV